MNFSAALSALKAGSKIYRSGWNGKHMWIVLQNGYPQGVPINENTASALGLEVGTIAKFDPYILMCNAKGSFVPWLATPGDILGDDWFIVQD